MGPPYEATKRVRGVPKFVGETHADCATGAFGGAPYGATNRVRGVPKWWTCGEQKQGWEEGGGGGSGRRRRRGAPSLQNEDPTPQDGWEKGGGRRTLICESCVAGLCALELLVTHTLRTFVSVVQFELLVTHTLLVCAFFNIGNGIVGINGIIGRAAALWGFGALQAFSL